jgi:methyltransferase (TIGR00027 family)
MRDGSPSATAEMVCSWRALEHTLPAHQRIVDDPYARGFLGRVRGNLVDGAAALPAPARRSLLSRLDQALHGAFYFVLARHRAIDDLILNTPSDQVVLLGAGYDTRRARLCERLHGSRVFEVDHPDTARRKAQLEPAVYAEADLAPSEVVTIDFARDPIEERLCAAGLDPDARTIWVWEGVSMYLSERAVRDTLGLMARLSGAGSCAVCDLLSDPDRAGLLAGAHRQMLEAAMEWVYSEPFQWHCRQQDTAGFFSECGLVVQEDVGLNELADRYGTRHKGWPEVTPWLRLVVSEPCQV